MCQTRKTGDICPFCRSYVSDEKVSAPKNFRSSILNAFLILLISMVSMGMVVLEGTILARSGFNLTEKTITFVIPSEGQYAIGETFLMPIELVGIKKPINAIQSDFVFDPRSLELVDIVTQDSFASIFIQKQIDNELGYGRISGGLPNPGFFAERGVFATAVFKAKQVGLTQVRFLPSSLVLENNGEGTNLLKDLTTASYLIVPESVVPQNNDQQSQLIKEENLIAIEQASNQLKFGSAKEIGLSEPVVLGVSTDLDTIEDNKDDSFAHKVVSTIVIIDRLIINFWQKIISWLIYVVTLRWLIK